MKVKIKYFNEDYPRLEQISIGDWIDLRVDRIDRCNGKDLNVSNIEYKAGDIIRIGLGVAMELPAGYEALISPRSSTFKHWGVIQTNSTGVIDNSYNGNNDEWLIEFIALKDGKINRFDRVSQFRILENQPAFKFEEVEELKNDNRGGYGTSGKN